MRLLDGTFSSAGLTVLTEPMTDSFFWVPKATTVTSSNWLAESFIRMTKTLSFPTVRVWDSLPKKSKTSRSVGLTPASSKEPSKSVMTPLVEPTMETVAPGSGAPDSSSTTDPLTVLVWAKAATESRTRKHRETIFLVNIKKKD